MKKFPEKEEKKQGKPMSQNPAEVKGAWSAVSHLPKSQAGKDGRVLIGYVSKEVTGNFLQQEQPLIRELSFIPVAMTSQGRPGRGCRTEDGVRGGRQC